MEASSDMSIVMATLYNIYHLDTSQMSMWIIFHFRESEGPDTIVVDVTGPRHLFGVNRSVSSLHLFVFPESCPSAASLTELMPAIRDAVLSVGLRRSDSQPERAPRSLKIKYRGLVLVYLLPFLTYTPPSVILWCHP